MKIALDAMGGDNAPLTNILGAKDALAEYPSVESLYLVGDEATLKQACEENGLNDPRVQIVHAEDVVEMHESGAKTLRSKKKSSIANDNWQHTRGV